MESQSKTSPNVRQAVPLFGVVNLEASRRFYVEGLGFEMTNQWVHEGKLRWCWLQHGGAAVMLQEFWTDGHHQGAPAGKLGQGLSICFQCADALALYKQFVARGLQASKPFVGNGMWCTSVSDP